MDGSIEEDMSTARKPHYIGHRKRLQKRFLQGGADAFLDYELIEFLLAYAIPRKEIKPIAKSLEAQFGSLAGVLDASQRELEAIPGIGTYSAVLIRLTKELSGRYLAEKMKKRDLLASPEAVVDFARVALAGLPHENFMVIYLNIKNEVIGHEIVHEGTVDRAVIYPRRIIESALACHAAGVILLHNHPSGHPEPSAEDESITRAIAEAARTVDIHVLDHIVIGKGRYFSLREKGTLDNYA